MTGLETQANSFFRKPKGKLDLAELNNIEGWREEIDAFRQTQAGRDYFAKYGVTVVENPPIVSADIPIKLATLLLEQKELRPHLNAVARWELVLREHGGHIEDNDPLMNEFPQDSLITINKFAEWYMTKLEHPIRIEGLTICANWIATSVQNGEFYTPDGEDARALVRDKFSRHFE